MESLIFSHVIQSMKQFVSKIVLTINSIIFIKAFKLCRKCKRSVHICTELSVVKNLKGIFLTVLADNLILINK